MSYRFMRLMLFFDLPVEKASERREYRQFVKLLKKNGFFMLQKSIYVKMGIDAQVIDLTIKKIKKEVPKNGNIMILTITEKQFSNIEIILGDFNTEVISTDERLLEL